MALGIVGKKLGSTQVYADNGDLVNVTVIEAGPCPVLAVREKSLQLGFDTVKAKSMTKPVLGYYKKLNIPAHKVIKEVSRDTSKEYKIGDEIKADLFAAGDFVDVSGTTIGKGFAGGMKRWNWKGQCQSHGSMSHRRIGSLGCNTTPGRVLKGHHLHGHMGNEKCTILNLKVVKIDVENNIIFIRGAVPGHKNSYVIVRKAIKKANKKAK
ncbi:MAG: 50S ribosomal protein L3 [Candidatus Omnitrophota bacterium]|jgi:large subunit ribosomal protein L3